MKMWNHIYIYIGLLLALVIVFLGCGIIDPGPADGKIQIVFDNARPDNVINKPSTTIESVQCLVRMDGRRRFWDYIPKEGGVFHAEIAGLEPSDNYSVRVWGKGKLYYVEASAGATDISIQEGETTTITLAWNPFVTMLDTLSPKDSITDGMFTFRWDSVAGSESYYLMVSSDSTFYDPTYTVSVHHPQHTLSIHDLPKGMNYWRVRCYCPWKSLEGAGIATTRAGLWSDISSFYLE